MLLSRIRSNITNYTRNQPIHSAANNPNCSFGVFKNILRNVSDVNTKNDDGITPLILAIKCAHKPPIIKLLLQWKASVNKTDESGQSPLHHAVSYKTADESPRHPNYELKVIKLLLYYGADINIRDNNGSTPLHCAVSKNNSRVDVINLLLRRDANIFLMNHEGYQPLHTAVSNADCNTEIIEMLLNRGASVNDVTDDDENPMHCAVQNSNCKVDALQLLLKRGSDVNVKHRDEGKSPLLMALENSCQLKVIKFLLDSKADINATCDIEQSALHYALKNSDCSLNICKLLINSEAQINVSNKYGETPLHCVLSRHPPKLDYIQLLLKNGASTNVKNEIGESPLQQFTRYNCSLRDQNTIECLKLLMKYTLLHDIDFDIQSCIQEWGDKDLFLFRWKCEDELQRIFSNDLFLFEILTGKQQLKFDTLSPSVDSVLLVKRILKKLGGNEYPFYTDIISNKLTRKTTLCMLEEYPITSFGEETISLDFFSMCNIGEYLEDKDLLNTLLAFQKERNSFPKKSDYLNISKLSFKLGERFIDDPVKAYIARIKNV